jgi:hypothetical protein
VVKTACSLEFGRDYYSAWYLVENFQPRVLYSGPVQSVDWCNGFVQHESGGVDFFSLKSGED